jgi:hypothetical protein
LRVASTICCAALCGGWGGAAASLASFGGADEKVLLTLERMVGRRPVSGSSWKGLGKVVKLEDVLGGGGPWLEKFETGEGPLDADTPVSRRRCGSDIGRAWGLSVMGREIGTCPAEWARG